MNRLQKVKSLDTLVVGGALALGALGLLLVRVSLLLQPAEPRPSAPKS